MVAKKVLKKINKKVKKRRHPNDDHVYMTEEDDIEKIERGIESWKWTLKINYLKIYFNV